MNRINRTQLRAFTIIELLVAMSITATMMFLVNRLFFDTVNAVGQGAQLSDILAASRTISDQIQQDADHMVGPTEGGFLVIINKKVNVQTTAMDGTTLNRYVRSDQIVFIRNSSDIEPLTPGTDNAFSHGVTANYARVWYGHVLRAPDDPTVMIGSQSNNSNATNWILGRQALFLAGSAVDPAIHIHVNGATYNSPIPGLGILSDGYSDVSNLTLNDLTGPGVGALDGYGLDTAGYKTQAYQYAFPPPNSNEEPGVHLQVDPTPDTTEFSSQQIAQMHPYFMENVSDFVVEFAMDIDKDDGQNEIKRDGNGNIEWFGVNSAGVIDEPYLPPPTSTGYDHRIESDLANGSTEDRFTFRHDYPAYWPYLIRIRYRLHDARGRYGEYVGDSTTGDRESGKWFEQIIAVNRD